MRVASRLLPSLLAAALVACGGSPDAPDAATQPPPGMVLVPEGDVPMGDVAGATDEQPVRTVHVSAFYIDRLEATQAEWQACMDAGVCAPVLCQDSPYWAPVMFSDHPTICMTWSQAAGFCAWKGRRLPSEAEWERAARGDDGRAYPWGDAPPDCTRAFYADCGPLPVSVGGRAAGASPFGAEDMVGDVREWTADWYAADAYATQPSTDPPGPASGSERVVRGGGLDSMASGLRAAARDHFTPVAGAYDLGVRCARSK